MLDFLIPNYYFDSIHDLEDSFFINNNVKAVLFDIDNTLEPYATAVPSKKTLDLFSKLKTMQIKTAIVSNNHKERVEKFCEILDVPFSFDSAKPSTKRIDDLIKNLKVPRDNVIIVGDQLFTDIWAGSNANIVSVLVNRINNKESFFIKLKRVLELPVMLFVKKKGYGKIK